MAEILKEEKEYKPDADDIEKEILASFAQVNPHQPPADYIRECLTRFAFIAARILEDTTDND